MSSQPASRPQGAVEPGYEAVLAAFERNFAEHDEVGAALAVVHEGRLVVDVWSGWASPERDARWERDTAAVIFSGTKGLVALCLLILIDRGRLDVDAAVASYWPEFGHGGKQRITVKELASHRARLPGLQRAVTEDDLLDDRAIAALLAAARQDEDPRAPNVYHAFTFGWLCGELIRRVDGRSVGRFFAEEIAAPLNLDIWIGIPPEVEPRVATLEYAAAWGTAPQWSEEALARDELLARVWSNPPLFPPGRLPWNRPDWHAAEIPGAGAIATARAMARLYGCLALGGTMDGVRLVSPKTLAHGREVQTHRVEPLLVEDQAFGLGFQLQSDAMRFGPPMDAFGHGGAGGSVHCAWPSEGVGVSYTMNALRDDRPVDPRADALLREIFKAVRFSGRRGEA